MGSLQPIQKLRSLWAKDRYVHEKQFTTRCTFHCKINVLIQDGLMNLLTFIYNYITNLEPTTKM